MEVIDIQGSQVAILFFHGGETTSWDFALLGMSKPPEFWNEVVGKTYKKTPLLDCELPKPSLLTQSPDEWSGSCKNEYKGGHWLWFCESRNEEWQHHLHTEYRTACFEKL